MENNNTQMTTKEIENKFEQVIALITNYNENAMKSSNGITIDRNYDNMMRDFDKKLSQGEWFEMYYLSVVNEYTSYHAVKLQYGSELYEKYNHVDIAIYKDNETALLDSINNNDNEPFCLVDCKIQCRTFYQAKACCGLEPSECIISSKVDVLRYQKNTIPTYLVVYLMNDSGALPGLYIINVKYINGNYEFVKEGKGESKVKWNVPRSEFNYYPNVHRQFDREIHRKNAVKF